MKTYNFDLLNNGAKEFEGYIESIKKVLLSDEFKEFLLNKCRITLENICSMNIPITNHYEPDIENNYMAGMKTEIGEDYILLYNDSTIDINSKNMSETTKAKYPAQLSLAKIVEYGIGAEGANSVYQSQVEGWDYDVNNHGSKGWYYKDDSGNIYWTDGFKGCFIFYKLVENVEEFIGDWIVEYLQNNL